MDGTWLFRLDPSNEGLRSRWNRSGSTAGWSRVTVPNVWNLGDDSPASMIGGVGWYRKDFSLPDASRALEWAVRFESVNYRSTVWLNGRRVGTNRGAYIPFEFRLNGLKRRGTNRLVIRVDSKRRSTDFPPSGLATNGAPTGGWWNYSGLQREVYLKKLNVVDWKSVRVIPRLACASCTATVQVRAIVRNVRGSGQNIRISGNFGSRRLSLGSRGVSRQRRRLVQHDVPDAATRACGRPRGPTSTTSTCAPARAAGRSARYRLRPASARSASAATGT